MSPDMSNANELKKPMREKALDEQQMLTQDEAEIASRLFQDVFPDLVRNAHQISLKEATEETVAALVAGLIALREASGNKP